MAAQTRPPAIKMESRYKVPTLTKKIKTFLFIISWFYRFTIDTQWQKENQVLPNGI